MDTKEQLVIDEILEKYEYDRTKIIGIMQDVQEQYRYLPQEALCYIAEKLGMSEAKVYGVATFYGNFSLDAKGKYVLKVCRGTACHVRKSANVLQALYEATGLSEKKSVTEDGLFSIEIVSCLGACGLSPVVMVNDVVHAAMTPDKARSLIEELRKGA
ncbi:MAG: NAD(P)H-dependent oxidoreductase subunit E [Oscillospiraceae bacterium]|nr:NAD(P)H-dependent oxidoreductase subunit E [Oscillospiraceae bacterium]